MREDGFAALRERPAVARQRSTELVPDTADHIGVRALGHVGIALPAPRDRRQLFAEYVPHAIVRLLRHDAGHFGWEHAHVHHRHAVHSTAGPCGNDPLALDPRHPTDVASLDDLVEDRLGDVFDSVTGQDLVGHGWRLCVRLGGRADSVGVAFLTSCGTGWAKR